MSIIGLEIGTTGCLAAVFTRGGVLLGRGYRGYPLHEPASGALELHPLEVLTAARQAVADAVEAAEGDERIQALAISAQGEAIFPVDATGQPLGPALTTFDARPQAAAHRWAAAVGEDRLYALTGLPFHPMASAGKLAWWRHAHADVVAIARRFVPFDAWMLQQCGVDPVTDYSMAGRTQLLDLDARAWSAELLASLDINAAQLPRLVAAGTPLGVIPDEIARAWRLPSGVLAVAGGHDQACAALGCGAIEADTAMDATGATECLAIVLEAPRRHDALRAGGYGCYPHVVPERFLTLAYNFSAGALLQWYRATLGAEEEEEAQVSGLHFYDICVGKAGHDPSPLLVLPYFTASGTPWLDPHAQGVIFGLSLATTKTDIIKGLLDGIGYEMRLNLERLAEAGVPVSSLRAVGASAASPTWLQLKANIYGRPLAGLSLPEAPCLGAALLAGRGAGIYPTLSAAVDEAVAPATRADPDPTLVPAYTAQYRRYAALYPALREIMQAR